MNRSIFLFPQIKDKLELEEALMKVRSKEKNAKGNQVEVEEATKVKSKEKNIKGNQVNVPTEI